MIVTPRDFNESLASILNGATKQDQLIDTFIKYTQALTYVLQSQTMSQVLENIEQVARQIFKVAKVSFLFLDKDVIKALGQEGARFRVYKHAYGSFHVYVPDRVKPSDFQFEFGFTNVADMINGKIKASSVCAVPINKLHGIEKN